MKKIGALALAGCFVCSFAFCETYENYQGDEMGVRFEFPKSWNFKVENGDSEPYMQATIKGPRNKADTFTSAIVVRRLPKRSGGGRFNSPFDLKTSRIGYLFKNGRLLEDKTRKIGETQAFETVGVYRIPPLLMHGTKPIAIDVKTRMLFFEKNDYLYEIIYNADAAEFDGIKPHFERFLKNFSLK